MMDGKTQRFCHLDGPSTLCYPLRMTSKPTPAPIWVIGALNLDICGIPGADLKLHDSNPGRVSMSSGGVGHNIARHIAAQGLPVELISLTGDDYAGTLLRHYCAQEGIGHAHVRTLPGASSVYMSLQDEQGDMVAAINDMQLLDRFDPAQVAPLLDMINASPLVVMDANLPQATLSWLVDAIQAPILLDPVSGIKAARVRDIVGRFAAIKPNALEAQLLSGEREPDRQMDWFLSSGVRYIFISAGEGGVYYASGATRGHLPATPMDAPNCNGAGDSMCAGIAIGMARGMDVEACAALGIQTVTQHLISQGGILK